MTPSRFQPLRRTYKELCTLLYDTVLCLHNTDFTHPEAADAIQKTKTTLSFFEHQAAAEEAVLFSAVYDYEPFMVAILRDDYRERMQYIHRMQELICANETNAKTGNRIFFGNRLLHQFTGFMACCIGQMKDHETMLNPVLWRYYSDEELQHIAASVSITKPTFTNTKPVYSLSFSNQ